MFVNSRVVRKAIARVYIVMHQKQKENLRKFYKVWSKNFLFNDKLLTVIIVFDLLTNFFVFVLVFL